jgi:excisionase family DNA binding protein
MSKTPVATSGSADDDPELRFFTVEEVSRRLGIRKLGIYSLIKNGDLRAARFGRRLRISVADFKAYVRKASPPPVDDFPFEIPFSPVDA